MVAPFIAERVWGRKAFAIKLTRCRRCEFAFFNPRLDRNEERELYQDYRTRSYQQSRFRHEPWYTESLNRELSAETAFLDVRRKLLASVVGENAEMDKVNSVLDFGGDHGQLIEKMPAHKKYVYDISGVEKKAGVIGLQNLNDCLAHDYDLIVCSHVLEHVGFPKDLLAQMRQLSRPGTLLYLEVPFESPFSLFSIAKRVVQTLVLCVTRMNDAKALARPGSIYLMHEHVNFFMAKTLAVLAQAFGFQVVASGRYASEASPLMRAEAIWCLARL